MLRRRCIGKFYQTLDCPLLWANAVYLPKHPNSPFYLRGRRRLELLDGCPKVNGPTLIYDLARFILQRDLRNFREWLRGQ